LEIIYPFSSCRLGSAWEMHWMKREAGKLSWTHDILQVGCLWMFLKARIMFLSWYWYVLMAWPLSLFFPFSPSPVVAGRLIKKHFDPPRPQENDNPS
jgi:hypothetical protein